MPLDSTKAWNQALYVLSTIPATGVVSSVISFNTGALKEPRFLFHGVLQSPKHILHLLGDMFTDEPNQARCVQFIRATAGPCFCHSQA